MGALSNAANLIESEEFRGLVRAAAVYTATIVISEDDTIPNHEVRKTLAIEVLVNQPIILDRLVSILAGTPAIATAGTSPSAIPDQAILDRTADVWTALALIIFPPVAS